MSGVPSFAQETLHLDRPAAYQHLIEAKEVEQVADFVSSWSNARLQTLKAIEAPVQDIGQKSGIERLTPDILLGMFIRGGQRAEAQLCLSRPKDIAAVALIGKREHREEFINMMWHVELNDMAFTAAIEAKRETLAMATQWASVRASFAEDFSIKRSSKESQYRVTVETVSAKLRKPAPGFEVMYVLELWEADEKKHLPFPKFSTPTEFTLTPGKYVFYCRSHLDGKISEGPRRHINISADTPLDLFAP